MSGLLIGLAIVGTVLAITTPWDAGQAGGQGGGGLKAQFLSQVEEEMDGQGVPDSVTDCFVDGLDGEFTDADAQMFPVVFGPTSSRAEAEADPAQRAMVEKLGVIGISCAQQLAEASGEGAPTDAVALIESLRLTARRP